MARQFKIRALKIAATIVLLWALYRNVDAAAFKAAAAGLRVFPLVFFFPLCAFNMTLSAWRWRTLLRADGMDIPLRKLFASYWIASFFNLFMPSNIGGDVFRIADIAGRSDAPVGATVSVFMDRLVGFVAMAFLGFVFPLAGLRLIPAENCWIPLLAAAVFLCLIGAALIVSSRFFGRLAPKILRGKLRAKAEAIADKARTSFEAYWRHPAALAKCFAVSIVFQMLMVAAVWCVGESFGLGIPFAKYCIFVPMINLMESIPTTINGMGFRDMGYAVFFASAGVSEPKAAAGAAVIVYMMLTLIYASCGGLLFMARSRAAADRKHPRKCG